MTVESHKLVIQNIGLMLSGDLAMPLLDADCVVSIGGVIAAVGKGRDMDLENPDQLIDANGMALAPGLIDSHVHPVLGDYTPWQSKLNWIDSCLHGGTVLMIVFRPNCAHAGPCLMQAD
jgi:enamidase